MAGSSPEVPMELVGVALPHGCMETMAQCLVEEYMFLGWSDEEILSLFLNPCFRSTHNIYRSKGEEFVRSLIQEVRTQWNQGRILGGKAHA